MRQQLARRDPTVLLQIIEEIYHIKDLDTLLEKVLFEARGFVNAEAGTIYLAAAGSPVLQLRPE